MGQRGARDAAYWAEVQRLSTDTCTAAADAWRRIQRRPRGERWWRRTSAAPGGAVEEGRVGPAFDVDVGFPILDDER